MFEQQCKHNGIPLRAKEILCTLCIQLYVDLTMVE